MKHLTHAYNGNCRHDHARCFSTVVESAGKVVWRSLPETDIPNEGGGE